MNIQRISDTNFNGKIKYSKKVPSSIRDAISNNKNFEKLAKSNNLTFSVDAKPFQRRFGNVMEYRLKMKAVPENNLFEKIKSIFNPNKGTLTRFFFGYDKWIVEDLNMQTIQNAMKRLIK